MNALQQLHSQANEAFLRRLQHEMSAMWRGLGGISTASQEAARSDAVSPDEAGIAGQGSDIGEAQRTGLRAGVLI